ncbi:hypothetical protein CALVIDRAFT_213853 [Calocera viscosa TUFC12733]|uniref:Uncharacterized protein n=1 Tax=Calocera viscosa (strain TUFC12733) TaxID=1330018 RepID=A0A167RDS9_CALVF|nr:hypothetical protein CALVIDRAFT_213853 [Calocera viscosa TUFC12733]
MAPLVAQPIPEIPSPRDPLHKPGEEGGEGLIIPPLCCWPPHLPSFPSKAAASLSPSALCFLFVDSGRRHSTPWEFALGSEITTRSAGFQLLGLVTTTTIEFSRTTTTALPGQLPTPYRSSILTVPSGATRARPPSPHAHGARTPPFPPATRHWPAVPPSRASDLLSPRQGTASTPGSDLHVKSPSGPGSGPSTSTLASPEERRGSVSREGGGAEKTRRPRGSRARRNNGGNAAQERRNRPKTLYECMNIPAHERQHDKCRITAICDVNSHALPTCRIAVHYYGTCASNWQGIRVARSGAMRSHICIQLLRSLQIRASRHTSGCLQMPSEADRVGRSERREFGSKSVPVSLTGRKSNRMGRPAVWSQQPLLGIPPPLLATHDLCT